MCVLQIIKKQFLFKQAAFPELLRVMLSSPKENRWGGNWNRFCTSDALSVAKPYQNTEGYMFTAD